MRGEYQRKPLTLLFKGAVHLNPVFAKINKTLVLQDDLILFLCNKYVVIKYEQHLGAYEVALMNEKAILRQTCLYDHHPLDEYNIVFRKESKKFIRLKYTCVE